MDKKEYQELKKQAKAMLLTLTPPMRKALVGAAYRVNKAIFNGQERLTGFWEAILINVPNAKR